MKNRQRYISIWLFILSILLTLLGIFYLQDRLTMALSEQSLEEIKKLFQSMSYTAVLLLILQSAICWGIWLIVRINKIDLDISTDYLEPTDIETTEEKIKAEKNNKGSDSKFTIKAIELANSVNAISAGELTFNEISELILKYISKQYEITQGIVYRADNDTKTLHFSAGYAYFKKESETFEFGEGLAGQVAKAQRIVNIQSIPAGYIKTVSGLGESVPSHLIIVPILSMGKTIAVIEMASFIEFSRESERQFELLAEIISGKLLKAKQLGDE